MTTCFRCAGRGSLPGEPRVVPAWTVPYHQDYRFVHGTRDVLTVWTPLHRRETGRDIVDAVLN